MYGTRVLAGAMEAIDAMVRPVANPPSSALIRPPFTTQALYSGLMPAHHPTHPNSTRVK